MEKASARCLLPRPIAMFERWPLHVLSHVDHVWITTDQFNQLHKNEFDKMPCYLESIENPRLFEKMPNPISKISESRAYTLTERTSLPRERSPFWHVFVWRGRKKRRRNKKPAHRSGVLPFERETLFAPVQTRTYQIAVSDPSGGGWFI